MNEGDFIIVILNVAITLVPIIGVYFENSNKLLTRGYFVPLALIYGICIPLLLWSEETIGISVEYWAIAKFIWLITGYFVMQCYVRRARDAGFGKVIVYLSIIPFSIIPFLNIITSLLLLIAPSVKLDTALDSVESK